MKLRSVLNLYVGKFLQPWVAYFWELQCQEKAPDPPTLWSNEKQTDRDTSKQTPICLHLWVYLLLQQTSKNTYSQSHNQKTKKIKQSGVNILPGSLFISCHRYSIFYFLPRTGSIKMGKYPHFSLLLPSVHWKSWYYITFSNSWTSSPIN